MSSIAELQEQIRQRDEIIVYWWLHLTRWHMNLLTAEQKELVASIVENNWKEQFPNETSLQFDRYWR